MKFIVVLITLFFLVTSCQKELESNSNNAIVNEPYVDNSTAQLYTNYSDDWDNWRIKLNGINGEIVTKYSEDWDNWKYNYNGESGEIRTVYSDDWDNWQLISSGVHIRMQTKYSNDWDNWRMTDLNTSAYYDIRTAYSDDFDNWDVFLDNGHIDFQTTYSDDYDNWKMYGEFDSIMTTHQKISILFIPIFASAIHQQGLTE